MLPGPICTLYEATYEPPVIGLMELTMETRFGKEQMHQAFRLLSACALAGGCATLTGLPEGYWAVITAIVVMQPELSKTLSAGRDRIAATLVGAVFGMALVVLRQQGLPTLPLFMVGLIPLAMLTAVIPTLRLACTTLVVVFLIPATGDVYLRPIFRVADILVGALACLIVSVLVFPTESGEISERP